MSLDEVAVITGDVISSRRHEQQYWMPALKSVLSHFGQENFDWALYRGDAFQIFIHDAPSAFESAMLIKAGMRAHKGLDVRLAMGVGTVDVRAPQIGESNGPAFVRAGSLVEELDSMRTTLAVRSANQAFDEFMNASLGLAAAIMDKWLPNYAQAVACSVQHSGETQVQLAKRLGIAQNTLSERLGRAHYRALRDFERAFRQAIQPLGQGD